MKIQELKIDDALKLKLQQMENVVAGLVNDDDDGTGGGGSGSKCGAYCKNTCSYYCRATCTAACKNGCQSVLLFF